MKLIGSINLNKIDKSAIVDGDKGKYLSLEMVVRPEEDQYGNRGFIAQGVSKERRANKQYGEILGNIKFVFEDDNNQSQTVTSSAPVADDLPF